MKKKFLYITLVLLIILNIAFFISDYLEKNSAYIILDSKNIWKVSNNGDIKKISKNKIKKLSFSNANLYYEDKTEGYFGSNKIYTFYDKKYDKQQNLFDSLVVIGDLKIKNYVQNSDLVYSEEDLNIIDNYLKNYNITYDVKNTTYKKFLLENNKSIFSITSSKDSGGYSTIFLYENGKSSSIYFKSNDGKRISSLNKIVDINDNSMLILLSDIPGSDGNECYSLYRYNDSKNNYYPVINCEKEE